MTKSLIPTEIQKIKVSTKTATKNFDYTTIADRLRTVRMRSDSHSTGVAKPVHAIPTLPQTTKAVQDHACKNLYIIILIVLIETEDQSTEAKHPNILPNFLEL